MWSPRTLPAFLWLIMLLQIPLTAQDQRAQNAGAENETCQMLLSQGPKPLIDDQAIILWNMRRACDPADSRSLSQLEQAIEGQDERHRFFHLSELAKTAFNAGEFGKAEAYAGELLLNASKWSHSYKDGKVFPDGSAIHDGNLILGRLALRHNDLAAAKRYLLAAGQTAGSPVLGSFGPNVSLARDLLVRGEFAIVLEYFKLCRNFWDPQFSHVDEWSAIVKKGGMPTFRSNLLY